MLQGALYSKNGQDLRVSVERNEVLLMSDEILNFPRIIELEGDRLVLAYGKGRHTGVETRPGAVSEDFGRTWTDSPPGFPMADNVQTSGILGYMGDDTIAYIDVFPVNTGWSQGQGLYHEVAKVEDPIFRLRRFSGKGDLLSDDTFKVNGIPWGSASYELYGTLLTLDNGDLLTAFGGRVGSNFTTFIVRSKDCGESFEYVTSFGFEADDGDGGDQVFAEADLEVLANGDILCMMRTGSDTPMHQSRSTDGGRTWSGPMSVGWPGVKPHLRLLSNGVLACSSGRGVYGHPQVTYVMFSIDGTGEEWEYPFSFHTGPGCSYTSNMEREGKLYVAYSHSSFTKPSGTYGLPYHSIKWVVIDAALSAPA